MLDREFASIEIGDGILVNSIKGYWTARKGYFVRFKIYIPIIGGGEINVTNCILETIPGGILRWVSPHSTLGRVLETDTTFYRRILEAFEKQSWIPLIGSSKLKSDVLKLPPGDPLAEALAKAKKAL
jgi:hypothetical protein